MAVAGAALATIGGCLTVVAPGTAFAASCTFTSGKSSNLSLSGGNGLHPTGGKIFTKPSGSACSDLNVTTVSATDHYEGVLFSTRSDKWSICSRGFIKITKGNTAPVVLCSGVKATTQMAVVQQSNTQRTITAEY
jgi:hypothetical protein